MSRTVAFSWVWNINSPLLSSPLLSSPLLSSPLLSSPLLSSPLLSSPLLSSPLLSSPLLSSPLLSSPLLSSPLLSSPLSLFKDRFRHRQDIVGDIVRKTSKFCIATKKKWVYKQRKEVRSSVPCGLKHVRKIVEA